MPIAELGYRTWEGVRTGAGRRWLAITRSEVAIALKSSKLLRRFAMLAWVPILYFCPFFLAIGYVANPDNELAEGAVLTEIATEFLPPGAIEQLRAHPESVLPAIWAIAFYVFFAYTQSFLSMVMVAIVGPPLIAKDLRSKAFLVYFSKPIEVWQYLLGKAMTVAFFVFTLTLFPALLLFAIGSALAPNLGTALATLPMLLRIAAAAALIATPVALVALLLSSLTRDRRIATFAWLAVWIFGEIAFRVLTVGGGSGFTPPPWAGLLSLRELTTRATAGVFELDESIRGLLVLLGESGGRAERMLRNIMSEMGDAQLERAGRGVDLVDLTSSGYPPSVSIAVLAGLSVVCYLLLRRRVLAPVRI
ncbi:MAG: hypothetical protein AB7O97_21820 [Planctomycetota bacterium]